MSLIRRDVIHVAGSYTTVGAAAVVISPPVNGFREWTVAYNGVGDATVTMDRAIDLTERVYSLATRTALAHLHVGMQSDTTFQVLSVTIVALNAALESIVDFVVYRVDG